MNSLFSKQQKCNPAVNPSGLFSNPDGKNHLFTFVLVTSLFLLWGFCNGMIDVMDKHFQQELHLTLAQSANVQWAHYLGYFLMALPAGWLATRLGYKGGIITGLLMVAVGGLWFIPATKIAAFWAFLVGVCLIAAGLTFLETIANPYTTVLGPTKYAATRINLAQSCNGIGWIFGPIAGSLFFYSKDATGQSTGSQTIWVPYVGVAVVVLVLAVVFYFANVPDIKPQDGSPDEEVAGTSQSRSIWSHPHFVFAVLAQFLYVAAQAGIFAFFINYITTETPSIPAAWQSGMESLASNAGILQNWLHGWIELNKAGVLAISDKGAANLASLAFICFLLGRFSGAALLKVFRPHVILGIYGLVNVAATCIVICKLGWLSVAAVFVSYFCMSIMFPTIFALGISGLGVRSKTASSFIVMAIMGGAVLPKLMGFIADKSGIALSFMVPLVCFAFVSAYGFGWAKLSGNSSASA
ncbi:MAG: MFS transporter [Verrucomicrobiota bacterium]